MSVNGKVNAIESMECSQCHEIVYRCKNCEEYFNDEDFISCGDDGEHICEACYEDFGPKAINEDNQHDR